MVGQSDPRRVGAAHSRTPQQAAAAPVPAANEPATHLAQLPLKPAPAALSMRALCERLDVSESTFHRMRDEDWMPRPIVLSSKVHRWIWAEVEEALRLRAPRLVVGAYPEPEALVEAGRAGRKVRKGSVA